jgi:hypothetical protein
MNRLALPVVFIAPWAALWAAGCGSSTTSDPNPTRLWYDLSGPEVAGQVQLVPFQPQPF